MKKGIKSYEDFIKEETEGVMYKPKLEEIAKYATEIASMLSGDEDLEAWVQDKITIAHHNMDAILGYMKSGGKETPKDVMQSKPLFSKENEK